MHDADAGTVSLWPLDDASPSHLRDLAPGGVALVGDSPAMLLGASPERRDVLPITVNNSLASGNMPSGWTEAVAGALTVELWLRILDSKDYAGVTMLLGIPLYQTGVLEYNSPLHLTFGSNQLKPSFRWQYNTAQSEVFDCTTELNNYDQAWHYLAVTRTAAYWNGSAYRCTASWYIDGVFVNQSTERTPWNHNDKGFQTCPMFFGHAPNTASYSDPLSFCLSDVRISSVARTAQEIAEYYVSYAPLAVCNRVIPAAPLSSSIFRLTNASSASSASPRGISDAFHRGFN